MSIDHRHSEARVWLARIAVVWNNPMEQGMKRVAIGLACVVVAGAAQAGGLYKCKDANGQTVYSQTQCPGVDNQAVVLSSTRPATGPNTDEIVQRCVAHGGFKDPGSVKILSVGAMGAEMVTDNATGTPYVAAKLPILLNGKNSYGAYAGARVYNCYLSRSDMSVVLVK